MTKEQFTMHQKVRGFFEKRGIECSLRGDPDFPKIVLGKGLILNAEIDFIGASYTLRGLIFYGKEGVEVGKTRIKPSVPTQELIELIMKADNILAWRLELPGTGLFVQSWQVEYAKTSRLSQDEHRYPLFSKFDPMVLPEKDARELAKKIRDYDVVPTQYDGGRIFSLLFQDCLTKTKK